jgi:hypothetical protein
MPNFFLQDFWVSVLYKKLVGHQVLMVSNLGDDDGTLRTYAHCSAKGGGSPVLFGVNIANFTQGINLTLNSTGELYFLTGFPNIMSRSVTLTPLTVEFQVGFYNSGHKLDL